MKSVKRGFKMAGDDNTNWRHFFAPSLCRIKIIKSKISWNVKLKNTGLDKILASLLSYRFGWQTQPQADNVNVIFLKYNIWVLTAVNINTVFWNARTLLPVFNVVCVCVCVCACTQAAQIHQKMVTTHQPLPPLPPSPWLGSPSGLGYMVQVYPSPSPIENWLMFVYIATCHPNCLHISDGFYIVVLRN